MSRMAERRHEDRIAYVISKLSSSNSSKAYSGLVEIRSSIIKSTSGVHALIRLGGLIPLINQLKKTSSKLIDVTLSIIGNLSLEPEFRDLVKPTSLAEDLIQIVRSIRDESILCRAYRAIGNLAEDPALSATLNDLRAPEMIMEAVIGHKIFYVEFSSMKAKRRSEQVLLEKARAVDSSVDENTDDSEREPASKLKNEEVIQMAVRALRQMGDTKKHRKTMFEEGLAYVLAEVLKSENPATLKAAIKAYDHFLANDEAKDLIFWANRKVNHHIGSNKFIGSKATDAYISLLALDDLGCKRILELCDSVDKRVQDGALAVVCKLSRQKEFRNRLGKEAIVLLLRRIPEKPKGTRGWMNLIHSLAYFAREHQYEMEKQGALPVLHSAMIDQSLPEELRHFILNAFVQFSFNQNALAQLYKIGLNSNLLKFVEDYTVNNKFEGCFSSVGGQQQTPGEISDDESMSESENLETRQSGMKREKSFRISSPSYLAIEEEIRQLRKDEGPEVYNMWAIPASSDVGSLPVSPSSRSEGCSSPLSYPSSPSSAHGYSPAMSNCSSPPPSPSEELFSSYEYASEPEEDEMCFSGVEEDEGERPSKKAKVEEEKKPGSEIEQLLKKSSDLRIEENDRRTESENFPLVWCLALLVRFQWMERRMDVRSDLEVLRVLTEYSMSVKEPLRRSGKIMARIAGKHDLFGSVLSEKFIQRWAKLHRVCKCDRHSLQSAIGMDIFDSISEVATSGIGIHWLRRLLKTDKSSLATCLPFLTIGKSDMLQLFRESFEHLESMLVSNVPEAIAAVGKYGREFLPSATPCETREINTQSLVAPCCIAETDFTFVTQKGQVAANRKLLTDNNEVFNAMLTRFHGEDTVPWGETGTDALRYLVHYISGCRKSRNLCTALKLKSSAMPILLKLADAYGVVKVVEEVTDEMIACKPTRERIVDIYKSVCSYEFPGSQVKRVQLLRNIVDSEELICAVLGSDAKDHFLLTIKDSVLSSLS